MARFKQKYGLLLIGIGLGIAYGIFTRWFFGATTNLASLTYLIAIPVTLGVVPLIFANDAQLRSYRNIIFIPWLTTLTLFFTLYISGQEGWICLLILAGPFFILGTLAAFIYRLVVLERERDKKKLLSLMLIPFLIAPIEALIHSPSSVYQVTNQVVIAASPETIWDHIVEVDSIRENEYRAGWFNHWGIPRPISATVDRMEVGGQRIGRFEGGLRFVETITQFEPGKRVAFDIVVDSASVRNVVFDQHVLKGNYFNFVDATYEITALPNGKTQLALSSRYQMTSKVNVYGKFWGDIVLRDFQTRLLEVIAIRCEKATLSF